MHSIQVLKLTILLKTGTDIYIFIGRTQTNSWSKFLIKLCL